MDAIDRKLIKTECEADHLFFTRYFFKNRQGISFRVNWHHLLIADTVDKIISGEIENAVINVSPGGTKTELVIINLIARGLALNPRARFLHLSGSDTLASLNSATARDLITSDEFQQFWPLKIAPDSSSKKRWNVMVDGQQAGGVYATALGGQVTGFRAGHMAPGFQGAILIDDPIKPEDGYSKSKTDQANRKLLTTVKSRKANPKTPIILIMQRVADNDCTAFIKNGNLEGNWTYVKIPAVMDELAVQALDERYRAHVEMGETIDGRFSYWPYKEPIDQLLKMEKGGGIDKEGARISRHVFWGQYQQEPKAIGGNIIHGKDFIRYSVLPKIKYRKIFADTAQKTAEQNDYSVFQEWGYADDGRIYLLDMIRGRWEAPELQKRAVAFWSKCKARDSTTFGQLRKMMVEDKASGTGLIQTLRIPPYHIPIEAIERHKDKVTRVMDALPYIEGAQVCVPEEAAFTSDFIAECEGFTGDNSHDFDDQIDPLCDAVDDMLQGGNKIKTWEKLGQPDKIVKGLPPSRASILVQRVRG